jgi:hypothetical protein
MPMYGQNYSDGCELNGRYIVWCPTSPQAPRVMFNSRPDAIKAAISMGEKYSGQRFAVCKIVGEAKSVKVSYEGLEDE